MTNRVMNQHFVDGVPGPGLCNSISPWPYLNINTFFFNFLCNVYNKYPILVSNNQHK